MDKIKKYFNKNYLFIALFVIIDAYCIYQYTSGMGLILLEAIFLSLGFASVLDITSYLASYFGAADLLVIPFVNRPQTKRDIIRAGIITLLVFGAVIFIQVFLINIRLGQMSEKDMAYSKEIVEYEAKIQAIDNDESLDTVGKARAKNYEIKPAYDGNKIIDYLSILVPIITTICSFVFGLLSGRKYEDRFKKEIEKLNLEKAKLEEQLHQKLSKYRENINILLNTAEVISLEDNITSEKLSKKGDEIIKMIENNLRKGIPNKYRIHNEMLDEIVDKSLRDIKQELPWNADDMTLILNFDFKNQFSEEFTKLNTLNKEIIG